MTVVGLLGTINGKSNRTENNGNVFQGVRRRDIQSALRTTRDNQLVEANERVQREAREQRRNRNRRRQTGNVSISNTDSVGRAVQVRGRLLAKIAEIAGSDLSPRQRDAAIADIKRQIERVERQISAIRRRERAVEEERSGRGENTPEARRRRARDMQERRINIRRDFLYHANRGGFDPQDLAFMRNSGGGGSVAFDIGMDMGTIDTGAMKAAITAAVADGGVVL